MEPDSWEPIWGSPKIRGTMFFGGEVSQKIRTIVLGGLYWVPSCRETTILRCTRVSWNNSCSGAVDRKTL